MKPADEINLPAEDDALIPDRVFAKLLGGATRISLWRWTRSNPDFPRPIKHGGKNHRRVGDARTYLRRLAERAE